MLKYFYKAWSGLSRFIYSQCVTKGLCVDFPLVGRFVCRPKSGAEGEESQQTNVCFIPHIDFLSSGKFSFPQNECNISPLSKRVPKPTKTVKVSLGAIGQSCEYDRDLVASILKDVMVKFVSYIFQF